jgi:hypothetical protein
MLFLILGLFTNSVLVIILAFPLFFFKKIVWYSAMISLDGYGFSNGTLGLI